MQNYVLKYKYIYNNISIYAQGMCVSVCSPLTVVEERRKNGVCERAG